MSHPSAPSTGTPSTGATFRLLRRLGHTRWFARLGRAVVPLDRALGRLTGGRLVGGAVPSLLLTTTGRKSGQPRTTPLQYARDGSAFVVVGSNWGQAHHPAWTGNLLAEPAATVSLAGRQVPVTARMATGEERDRLWGLLVAQWPAYESYASRAEGRRLRVFRLEPAG